MSKKNIPQYQCTFCKKRFVREKNFIDHRCRQMIRDEEFRTPVGQAAWSFYQKWMRAHRRMAPRPEAFLQSKFYNSFMKFARMVKKVQLPDPETFIWLMKEKDISPTIWTSDQVYTTYLEFLDRRAQPTTRAKTTIETLFKLADQYEVDVSEVFTVVDPMEVISLLRERQLSPWILLHSKRFRDFFVERANPEQRIIIESIVRPTYWAKQFESRPRDVALMKKYVEELAL